MITSSLYFFEAYGPVNQEKLLLMVFIQTLSLRGMRGDCNIRHPVLLEGRVGCIRGRTLDEHYLYEARLP